MAGDSGTLRSTAGIVTACGRIICVIGASIVKEGKRMQSQLNAIDEPWHRSCCCVMHLPLLQQAIVHCAGAQAHFHAPANRAMGAAARAITNAIACNRRIGVNGSTALGVEPRAAPFRGRPKPLSPATLPAILA